MDENKIAIIIYRQNGQACDALINSLNDINVPENYKIDIQIILGGLTQNKYSEYNRIINKNDSKYKIYLDENIEIVYKDFLIELVKIFKSDDKIGVIGCGGAKKIPASGVVLHSKNRFSKTLVGESKKIVDVGEPGESIETVESVDPFFIATQYDISWRDDLFTNDFLGVSAQCIEFKHKGYNSVVVKQDEAWIWVKKTNITGDVKSRDKFLNEYKYLFPKVLVLIPTYNRPTYFKAALESAINQTYKNVDIVIADNGTNDETETLVQPYLEQHSNIKYFRNPAFTANENWNFLRQYQINDTEHEYVNWLMDDDLFYPRKIEIMLDMYRDNSNVSLVTSVRNTIDEKGKVTGRVGIQKNNIFVMNGNEIGKRLFTKDNFIGEPTTVLIKKSLLRNNDLCWNEDENGFFSLVDVSTWLQLLSKGDILFYNKPLSAFRVHKNRATAQDLTPPVSLNDWAKEMWCAWHKKIFLKTEDDIHSAILNWINRAANVLRVARIKKLSDDKVKPLQEIFIETAKSLVNGYEMNHEIKTNGINYYY